MRLIRLSLLTILATVFLLSCKSNSPDVLLSRLYINTNVDDLSFGDYSKALVSYFLGDSTSVFNDCKAKIKYRGNASSHYDKKSFSLKFNKEKSFGNFACNKVWKLNAEYIDKTFMRNKLSYDLFRKFDKNNYAPHITYVEIYLNNEFRGIYAITERVDRNRLGLSKKEKSAVLFKEPPISEPPEKHYENFDGFIRFCNYAEFYKDFSKKSFNKLLREAYYNQRFPDVEKRNMKKLIFDITDFIFNSADELFANPDSFNTYFDLNNILDLNLLLLISNNSDGLLKNFYLYRKAQNQPYMFSPWDYDHGYGRDGDGEPNRTSILDVSRMKLIGRLIQLNAFNYRQKLYDRFIFFKQNNILTSDNLNKMIDANIKLLATSIKKNEQIWPPEKVSFFKDADFNSEIDLMKEWLDNRLPEVESYLKELSAENQ